MRVPLYGSATLRARNIECRFSIVCQLPLSEILDPTSVKKQTSFLDNKCTVKAASLNASIGQTYADAETPRVLSLKLFKPLNEMK
jgi:hypothetical protein